MGKRVKITASVGKGGKNRRNDVIEIQKLLNKWIEPKLAITGTCSGKSDDPTVKAIHQIQSYFMKKTRGLIGTHGRTIKKLNRSPMYLLPQISGYGYYSYGKGDWNFRQWGTKATVEALLEIARQFRWNFPDTLIGIGDISFRFGGTMKPHTSHRRGKNIDLRPIRKDKKMSPVTISNTAYDAEKTKLLIELFLSHKNVKKILFNDPKIYKLPRVSKYKGHHNHFHVTMYK